MSWLGTFIPKYRFRP